jgi:putative ABC transport system permease protein
VFAVLALVLAVVAVVISAGFARTMNGTFADPARVGAPYAVRIDLPSEDAAAGARVAAVLGSEPGVRSWFAGSERRVVLDGSAFLGRVFTEDLAGAGFIIQDGRLPSAAGEAMAGYGWLERFGRRVGDRVTVEIGGRPVALRVVGAYTEMEDSGEILRIPLAALRRVDPDAAPDQFYAASSPGTGPKELASALQARLRGTALVTPNQLSGDAEIDAFWLAFELVTGLVLVVALSNLGTTLLLAVRERVRDIGLLRSVGFTPAQALSVTATAAAILGVLALAIGIPLGWAAFRSLITSVGEGSGVGPTFGIDPSWTVVAAVIPLGIAVAVGLGVAVARRSARAVVADLVRYE